MHRFLMQDVRPDAHGRLDLGPIARQLRRVLRARPGAEILVLNGRGRGYQTRLTILDERAAWGEVVGELELPEPATRLILFQCALKADKFEWVLQKGTELGVGCFVPVISARTVVRPPAALEKKRARWEAILREATEQCGRGIAPHLAPATGWDAALHHPTLSSTSTNTDIHTDPLPPLRLLPWEVAAGAQAGPVPSLAQVVTAWRQSVPSGLGVTPRIACAIGPEGGLEASEVAAAQAAGWQTVHLGPRILRAETAALAATSLIMQLCGEFDT